MTFEHPGSAAAPVGPMLGSRGKRLLARIIDWIILVTGSWLLTRGFYADFPALMAEYQNSDNPMGLYGDSRYLGMMAGSSGVSLLLVVVYEGVLTKVRGATLGKMALGLRVEPLRGGQIGWGRSIIRVLVMNLPTYITCGLWAIIDNLWCTWDGRKQTLHDKTVKTIVVSAR